MTKSTRVATAFVCVNFHPLTARRDFGQRAAAAAAAAAVPWVIVPLLAWARSEPG